MVEANDNKKKNREWDDDEDDEMPMMINMIEATVAETQESIIDFCELE